MPPLSRRSRRFDFHAHTYLTDGHESATSMWWAARRLRHRVLAITDHVALEDPRPILERLSAESKAFENGPMSTLVGVELTLVPPRLLAATARSARKAGAQIVIVHGETTAEQVPAGTNRAAVESGEIDVLAHPGFLTTRDAERAAANGTALELSGRPLHGRTNGHVARTALMVGADLVVDSDAHDTDQLLDIELAETIARGAGLNTAQVQGAVTEAPARLYRRWTHR
jgi:histidinol phosphatase-like PHP family hydrolase